MPQIRLHNIIIITIALILFLVLLFLPFSIYGHDGYLLWYPIISEYFMGDRYYHFSGVIFNGQDLGAIYGELPFWKLFRLAGLGHNQFLNLTHFMWMFFFFNYIGRIIRGLKNQFSHFDLFFCLLITVLSPVILNRTMAGHLNLVYGILPVFALISLIFDKSHLNLFLTTLGMWFALSTVSYQVIAYHLFYIPILLWFIMNYEKERKRYVKWASTSVFIAFLANLPQFLRMLKYSADPDNMRSLTQNMVYSYTVSMPEDILHFFFSGKNSLLSFRPDFHFHEVNYPLGLFLLLFLIFPVPRQLKVILGATCVASFLFSADIFPGNLLAHLPVIKAFRVPQRIFMVPALIIPLVTFASRTFNFKLTDIILTVILIVLAQFIPYFELLALAAFAVVSAMIYVKKKHHLEKLLLLLSLSTLFVGLNAKIAPSIHGQKQYDMMKAFLTPLTEKFTRDELRKSVFHFSIEPRIPITTVAQSMGIRTIEGYGHPPKYLIYALEKKAKIDVPDGSNVLLIPQNEHKEEVIKIFTIDYIVRIGLDGQLIVDETTHPQNKKGRP